MFFKGNDDRSLLLRRNIYWICVCFLFHSALSAPDTSYKLITNKKSHYHRNIIEFSYRQPCDRLSKQWHTTNEISPYHVIAMAPQANRLLWAFTSLRTMNMMQTTLFLYCTYSTRECYTKLQIKCRDRRQFYLLAIVINWKQLLWPSFFMHEKNTRVKRWTTYI